jgi:hypothetical protein
MTKKWHVLLHMSFFCCTFATQWKFARQAQSVAQYREKALALLRSNSIFDKL